MFKFRSKTLWTPNKIQKTNDKLSKKLKKKQNLFNQSLCSSKNKIQIKRNFSV